MTELSSFTHRNVSAADVDSGRNFRDFVTSKRCELTYTGRAPLYVPEICSLSLASCLSWAVQVPLVIRTRTSSYHRHIPSPSTTISSRSSSSSFTTSRPTMPAASEEDGPSSLEDGSYTEEDKEETADDHHETVTVCLSSFLATLCSS